VRSLLEQGAVVVRAEGRGSVVGSMALAQGRPVVGMEGRPGVGMEGNPEVGMVGSKGLAEVGSRVLAEVGSKDLGVVGSKGLAGVVGSKGLAGVVGSKVLAGVAGSTDPAEVDSTDLAEVDSTVPAEEDSKDQGLALGTADNTPVLALEEVGPHKDRKAEDQDKVVAEGKADRPAALGIAEAEDRGQGKVGGQARGTAEAEDKDRGSVGTQAGGTLAQGLVQQQAPQGEIQEFDQDRQGVSRVVM